MNLRWPHQLIVGLLLLVSVCGQAHAQSTTVVISQVYSAEQGGSRLRNGFVELFNLGTTPITLSGWTLQISPQDSSDWTTIALSGNLAVGQYYLVTTPGGYGQVPLPQADLSSRTSIDPSGGRVALTSNNIPLADTCPDLTTVVDFVAYGSSQGCATYAKSLTPDFGLIRAGGGCINTGGNGSDFSQTNPYPRSTTSPRNVCGVPDTSAFSSFSVPAGGAVSQITKGNGAGLAVGSARVEPSVSNNTPSGLAIFGYRQGGILVSEASVPAVSLVTSALVYVEVNGSVNTGLAITNPNAQDVTVNLTYSDSNRGYAYPLPAGSFIVPANGQLAKFVNELPYGLGAPLQGTLEIAATMPVGVIALRGNTNERGEFLVTTLPVMNLLTVPSTDPAYLAHFAVEGGWRTDITLVNTTSATTDGTIDFRDPSGAPTTLKFGSLSASSFQYSLPAKTSQSFTLLGTGSVTRTGSVKITPLDGTATPVALAVFGYRRNNVTVSEAGLTAVSGSRFRTYVEASGAAGTNGSIQSGLAIGNAGTQSVTVTLTLTRLDGTPTGLTTTVPIPASGQIAKFLNELFPTMPASFQGILGVSATDKIAMIGLRSRVNERGDFLVTTVPPVDDAAPASSAVSYFPHFADSGGYTTQFVLVGTGGLSSTGNLHGLSTGGQPMVLPFQ